MSPAYRHPKAVLFHATLIISLLLVHYWLAPPLLVMAILLLAAALSPWFSASLTTNADAATADEMPRAFAELSKNLSRNTCHNALSAAQVAYSAEQLASPLQ
jgi:methyl-accepting chemotaxis protein